MEENQDQQLFKYYAVTVDNEYVGKIAFTDSQEGIQAALIAGLSSDPKIVKYRSEDQFNIYQVFAEEEFAGVFAVAKNPENEALIAGLDSDPKIFLSELSDILYKVPGSYWR